MCYESTRYDCEKLKGEREGGGERGQEEREKIRSEGGKRGTRGLCHNTDLLTESIDSTTTEEVPPAPPFVKKKAS